MVQGTVKQDLDLFKMPVEFQIQTDGEPEYARVEVVGESSEMDVKTERKPKAASSILAKKFFECPATYVWPC
jgi:hypothetical protein